MKRPASVGLIVLLLVASPLLLLGMKTAEPDRKRSITAQGSASVTATPDSARLFLEVSTIGKTPTEARQANAKQIAAVRSALVALKLPDIKTRTVDVDVSKVHGERPHEDAPRPVVGFEVTHSFTVLIRDLKSDKLNDAAGRVLDTALENGVESTDDTSFFKQDTAELRKQVMTKAVEDALANARLYAKGADVKVLEVVKIIGGGARLVPSRSNSDLDLQFRQGSFETDNDALSTSFLAGKIQLTCDVQIVCRF